MILSLFKKDPSRAVAEALFAAAAEQARRPQFYEDFGVADSVEGRFELLVLHIWMVLRRLKSLNAERLSRLVVDTFISHLDDSLREMGVGDLSVGRKMRTYAEGFYGRVGAYQAAAKTPQNLLSALARNVYGTEDVARASSLASYVQSALAVIDALAQGRVIAGLIEFPSPSAPSE
jgi:cytochrome b pre-mRNA-processing protein 3